MKQTTNEQKQGSTNRVRDKLIEPKHFVRKHGDKHRCTTYNGGLGDPHFAARGILMKRLLLCSRVNGLREHFFGSFRGARNGRRERSASPAGR
jgi:hypothetical protein